MRQRDSTLSRHQTSVAANRFSVAEQDLARCRATVATPQNGAGLPQRDGDIDKKCVGDSWRQAPLHCMHIDAPAFGATSSYTHIYGDSSAIQPVILLLMKQNLFIAFHFRSS